MQADPATLLSGGPTLDPREIERFERLSGAWWDPNGKFRPLHQQGPARLRFIRDALVRHFDRPERELKPLQGLSLLDVGCGGGLVSEPLTGVITYTKIEVLEPAPEPAALPKK